MNDVNDMYMNDNLHIRSMCLLSSKQKVKLNFHIKTYTIWPKLCQQQVVLVPYSSRVLYSVQSLCFCLCSVSLHVHPMSISSGCVVSSHCPKHACRWTFQFLLCSKMWMYMCPEGEFCHSASSHPVISSRPTAALNCSSS